MRVYLDTNVYNTILDEGIGADDLRDRLATTGIEVLSSWENLEELMMTAVTDEGRASALLRLSWNLSRNHKVLMEAKHIVTEDLRSFMRSRTETGLDRLFYSGKDARMVCKAWESGSVRELVAKSKPQVDAQKTAFLSSLRTGKNQIAPLWRDSSPDTTFERFREPWLWPKDGTEGIIEQICKRTFPGVRGAAIVRRIRSEDPTLSRLNRFRLLIEAQIALAYQDCLRGGLPTRGDGGDLRHAAYLGCCDVFVANDRRFTEILAHLRPPKPEVSDFRAFLSRHVPGAPSLTNTMKAPLGIGVAA